MTESDLSRFSDSAGVPWEGRSFSENQFSSDDGLADAKLLSAIEHFKKATGSIEDVITAFSQARLLIPLVAQIGESEVGAHGLTLEKSAELSIVTVTAPDGQNALPVFSSVSSMQAWNPAARPVPNFGRAVALAAASEGNTRIVLDPTSATELVIRRPAIAAIAQGLDWISPELNPQVTTLISDVLSNLSQVDSFSLESGDPECRLFGQELVITIFLEHGLDADDLQEIERSFFAGLAELTEFVELVDSVAVRYLPVS